ncbi:hypothetical protein [Calidifontibacter terrae]
MNFAGSGTLGAPAYVALLVAGLLVDVDGAADVVVVVLALDVAGELDELDPPVEPPEQPLVMAADASRPTVDRINLG